MELANIEKLLEKYFEAKTTILEEKTLQEYFSQEEVAPHLEDYKSLFQYFSIAKEEQFTKHVPLKTKRNYYKWISVAAVAVLVLGVYFGNQPSKGGGIDPQERIAAERAYQETKRALAMISQNLNKGKEKMLYLNEFEKTKNKIFN
ncbi:hypothetical protein GTQ40_04970 [Flavobacteriaceae bacterium R38]|nr:hypothetical protein [Flavobacteriaceae bacterium R38]